MSNTRFKNQVVLKSTGRKVVIDQIATTFYKTNERA